MPFGRRNCSGKTTAAATTGPASGPRPASSTPSTKWPSRQASRSRSRLGRSMTYNVALLLLRLLLLLPNPGAFAAQTPQIIEFGATNPTATNQLDRGDRRAVQREDALDSDARGDFSDGEGLVDPAT